MKNILKYSILATSLALTGVGCKKDFLNRNPTEQASIDQVFNTIEGFEAALHGMHRMMYEVVDHDIFGVPSLAITWDLMGEDFIPSGVGAGWFIAAYRYQDARNGANNGAYAWTLNYRLINNANQILSRIDDFKADQERKDFVKASALFYRAYAYNTLATCFMHTYAAEGLAIPSPLNYTGSAKQAPCVPIYTAPTQIGNERATVEEVYAQINSDLSEALTLMNNTTVARTDKSGISKEVIKGLTARVALTMHDWDKAATMAHEARESYPYMSQEELLRGFTDANNREWIWGSIINLEQNGIYASFLSHLDFNMNGYAALGTEKKCNSDFFTPGTAVSMDTTDIRRKWWVSREEKRDLKLPQAVYSQRKFKAPNQSSFAGDFPLMRSAEMALIEAEALVWAGRRNDAVQILTEFAKTRNPNFSPNLSSDELMIAEIRKQRRIELWGEGFRYGDIMRQQAVPDYYLGKDGGYPLDRNGGGHNSGLAVITELGRFDTRFLFRIPASETNTNRIPQNP
jgi:hypothetical protein